MGTSEQVHSNLAIPPGEYLAEVLDKLGMSQVELARRTARPPQAINEMIHGDKVITPQTALQLEQVLQVPAHIWLGLEADYQLARARHQEEQGVTQEMGSLQEFPYPEMARLGWVPRTRDPGQKVRNLRAFFGVSSLAAIPSLGGAYEAAFRQANAESASPHAQAAWLRAADNQARQIETGPYDGRALKEAAGRFRRLTRMSPTDFEPVLQDELSALGVALVLQPHLPRTYANGATFWLHSGKAALVLTTRGRWADIFWFSLFHEIGHLVLHSKRLVFLEDEGSRNLVQQEREADAFARDILIPQNPYAMFVEADNFSKKSVTTFADRIDIAPGIVVGRLQREGRLKYNQLTQLKQRHDWGARTTGSARV